MKYITEDTIEHNLDFVLENSDLMPEYLVYLHKLLLSKDLLKVVYEKGFIIFLKDGTWVLNHLSNSIDVYLEKYDTRINTNIYEEFIKPHLPAYVTSLLEYLMPTILLKFPLKLTKDSIMVHSDMSFKIKDNILIRAYNNVDPNANDDEFEIYSKTFVNPQ